VSGDRSDPHDAWAVGAVAAKQSGVLGLTVAA
jgi:hypothetical protein